MIKEIFKHKSILSAHIAQKLMEQESIEEKLVLPLDIAIVCHERRYHQKDLVVKMLIQLAEHDFLERSGEIFTLVEQWRRSLPSKTTSSSKLKELGAYQIYFFEQYLAKYFFDIVRNDIQKLEISKLVYYLDTIDASKGLQIIRSEAISQMNFVGTPTNILDINFGLGHSAIQLATLYPDSKVFSLQLNPSLREAFEYNIQRYKIANLTCDSNYPSEMFNLLVNEKVDIIYLFNPFGLSIADFNRLIALASQVATKGTKLLMHVPFKDQPNETLIAEWLVQVIEGIDSYRDFDYYNVILSNCKFSIDQKNTNSRFILATYYPDD
ncbi:MAG: hypothetical protein ACTSQB_00940 [Candidatus Heimdallarchaeota archaeon]